LRAESVATSVYHNIYKVVEKIPLGYVATYGQIAGLTGIRNPRQVGYALHALPADRNIPWHRVINHAGKISLSDAEGAATLQRILLESEGVQFDASGKINLNTYRWKPYPDAESG